MLKTNIIAISLAIPFILSGCGLGLSKDEASKIITESYDYPKPVINEITGKVELGSKMTNAFKKLYKLGFFSMENPKETSSAFTGIKKQYQPTEKGKGIIESIVETKSNGGYVNYPTRITYNGAVVEESLDSIQEILIDEVSKVANIKYTIKFEPIEPLYSIMCITNQCPYFGDKVKKKHKKKVKLKEYDKGWRVLE